MKKSFIYIADIIPIGTLILFLFLFSNKGDAATKTWKPLTGGSWTTANNWNPSGVPVDGDYVIIPSNQTGNITAVPTITLDSLVINGNCTLAGSANGRTITITQIFILAASTTLTMNGTNNTRINITLANTAYGTVNGTITQGNAANTFTNNGTLTMAPAGLISGSGSFINSSGATLEIGSTGGITTVGTNTGNIRTTYARTYATGANYVYNGTANQITGSGLTANTPANITIDNTGNTVTLSASTTLSRNLTISSGTLATNNYSISLAGDFINNGTFSQTTSTVNMTGSSKTIGGTNQTTFYNLTINNSSVTLLGNNVTVSNILTLSNGLLSLGNYDLNLTYPITNSTAATAAAIVGTFSSSTMIVATGSGRLIKTFANGATSTPANPILYTFPIGDTNGTAEYSPATIKFTGGTFGNGSYVGVRVTNSKHPNNSSSTNYLNRYWSLSSSGISAFTASFTTTYVPADVAGSQGYQVFSQFTGSIPWKKYATLSDANLLATATWPDLTSLSGDFTGITVLSPTVSISANPGFSVGQNDALSLTASPIGDPPFSYSWSSGENTQTINPSTASLGSTTYSITITDANGFTGTTSEIVNVSQIKTTPSSLTGFGYGVGNGPSTAQSFSVIATSLSANLVITAPPGFEVSLNPGFGFGPTTTILPIGGTVAATPVYVRMASGMTIGYVSDNIELSSTGSTSVNLKCVGTVLPAITASGGGFYCYGNTITLNSTSSGVTSQYWTGPDNFYSTLQNPQVTNSAQDANTGTYTVTGNAESGNNLITNGSFSDNSGFGHSYGYVSPANNALYPEGLYSIVANPHDVHQDFSTNLDHTGGGLQMVVNGATIPGVNIWSQTIYNITPNSDYQFTYWEQTVCVPTNPSLLQLYVNGVAAGPIYEAPRSINTWQQFKYNWNSGESTTAYLSLVNQNTTAGGNDFGLDDFRFERVYSNSSSVSVTVGNATAPTISISVSPSANICAGTSVTFTSVASGGPSPSYQWKVNGGNVGTNSSTYTTSSLVNGDRVTCVLTKDPNSCLTPNTATSNPIVMTVSELPTITTSGTTSSVCYTSSTQTTSLAYSATTGSPDSYYIDWNTAANNVGLYDQGSTSYSFSSTGGTLTGIVVSANTPTGTYSGTITLSNSNGCSVNHSISLIVNPIPTINSTGILSPICSSSTQTTTSLDYSAVTNSPTSYSIDWNSLIDQNNTACTFSSSGGTISTIIVPANTTAGTYYGTMTIFNTNNCSNTLPISLTVKSVPTPSFITSPESAVCLNSNSTYTTESGGGINNYFWNVPGTAGTDYSIISGGIGNSSNTVTIKWLTPGIKTVSVNYYNSGGCLGSPLATNTTTVLSSVNYGSVVSGDQTICNNSIPSSMSINGASGSGSFSYQWYYQTGLVSCPSGSSTSGWTSLGTTDGANTSTYTPSSAITTSRTYACFVTPGGTPSCGSAQWASNCRKVTLLAAINYGTVSSGDQTLCTGGVPASMSISGATGSGSFSYQWYYQTGLVSCPSGSSTSGWTSLGTTNGANTSSYTPSTGITSSRTYACYVTPGGSPSCGSAQWGSSCRKVTVDATPSGGSISGSTTVCPQINSTTLNLSGYSGTIQKWQSSPDGSTWTDITNTSNSYIASGLTTTTHYRAVIGNGACSSANSSEAVITVSDNLAPTISYGTSHDNLIVAITSSTTATSVAVDFTAFNDGSGARVINPTASDNCNVQSFSNNKTSTANASGNYNLGETILTWTATDYASHTTTSTQKVYAARENEFGINCPVDANLGCNPASWPAGSPSTFIPTWLQNLITAGTLTCDINISSVLNSPSGTSCSVTRTRTYTATFTIKIGGITIATISRSCTQTYSYVIDLTNPTFTTTCITNQTVDTNHSGCTYQVSGTGWNAAATDNCGSPTVTCALTGATTQSGLTTLNGVQFNVGTTTVTWTATDACSNSSQCSFTVTVNDISASVSLTSSDNECPQLDSDQGFDPEDGSNYNLGYTKVIFTVTRQHSASTNWNFTYTLNGTNVSLYSGSPNSLSGTITGITTASQQMIFWIKNIANANVDGTISVSSVSDSNSCSDNTSHTATVQIKPMPAVGPFE